MNEQVSFTLRGRSPDVLICIANLSKDEVFTPPELANRKPTASSATMTSSWNEKRCASLPSPAMMAKTASARCRFRPRFGCFANRKVFNSAVKAREAAYRIICCATALNRARRSS